MPVKIETVDVHINDKSLISADSEPRISEERLDVTTRYERDPDWIHQDSNGHMHAYSADGKLPTLKAEYVHEDCADPEHGDDCDGWDRTVQRCLICAELVKPGTRETKGRRYMPGLKSWEWHFRALARDGWRPGRNGLVSIWSVREGKVVHFGVGEMVINKMDSNGFMEGFVRGTAELGQR